MVRVDIFAPIFYEVVRKYAPWNIFTGGPGFPEKPLYHPDEEFGTPEHVELNYDEGNHIKSVIATNQNGDTASVEFELDDSDPQCKKMLCFLKKNSSVELTITEWFENNTIHLNTHHTQHDIDISLTKVVDEISKYEAEIVIDGAVTHTGIIDTTKLEVPQIVIDYAETITAMDSDITIAALDPTINGILTMEAYKEDFKQQTLWYKHLLNIIAACLISAATGGTACVYYI